MVTEAELKKSPSVEDAKFNVWLFSTLRIRFVADVKLGLPVPDGFWPCILLGRSSSSSAGSSFSGPSDRALSSRDLRPKHRTRPVRVFGVCAESRKAGERFVWEVSISDRGG